MIKRVLLGFLLLISGFFLLFSKTKIVDDEDLAVYLNDELVSSIPKKGEAMFIKSVCDNDGKASWDNDNWGLLVTNMSKKTKCNLYFYEGQTVFDFDYTGGEQVFTVPVSGTYKLETWGAQGGGWYEVEGGVGGYSSGNISFEKNGNIYVYVGEQAENYTGPGMAPGGGGSTYMLAKSGMIYDFQNEIKNIFIVSGGGGGSEWYNGYGGAGGGFKGNDGNIGSLPSQNWFSISPPATGGNQNSGGLSTAFDSRSDTKNIYNGSFGKGGYTSGNSSGSGGGQGGIGYYGGGASDYAGGGGGGSGYIGNPLLKDKVMYCYNCEESSDESTKTISTTCSEETPTENCSKKGNGYARITLVSIDE